LDVINVRGRSQTVKVYEVYDPETAAPDAQAYYQAYHTVFEACLERRFEAARQGFTDALSIRRHDPTATLRIERLDALDPQGLPGDWDGSVNMTPDTHPPL
jgi:hypothetical protein